MTKKTAMLINEIDPEELARLGGDLAQRAWDRVSIINHHVGKLTTGGKVIPEGEDGFRWLNVRQKQRAVSDWLLAMASTQEYREQYAQAALLDPFSHMKIVVSLMPKEMEIQVDGRVGVVILPAKVGSGQDWVEMATGVKPMDAEVLESSEALSAAETWRKMTNE